MTTTTRTDRHIYRLSLAVLALACLALVAVLTACQAATASHISAPATATVPADTTPDGACYRGAAGWWCDDATTVVTTLAARR